MTAAALPRVAEWHSWHLHVDSLAPQALDQVLLSAIVPVLAGIERRDRERVGADWASRPWFFIRYWQGGPHLRLRVADLTIGECATIEASLSDHLAAVNASLPDSGRVNQATYQRVAGPIAASGEAGTPLPVGNLEPCGVHRRAYGPEYARYGGAELIELTEHLFHVSSVVTLRACAQRNGADRRLIDGMEAMAATLSAWPQPREMAQAVRDGWLSWLSDSPSGLDETKFQLAAAGLERQARPAATALRALIDGAPSRWTPWTDQLRAASAVWIGQVGESRARQIFGSHLHMTQNRLGVGGGHEAYLAAALLAVLQDSGSGQSA